MKTKLMCIATLLLTGGLLQSQAQDKTNVKSKLGEATVFFQGAELVHTATTAFAKGENEIWVDGLSPNIDKNSLKIKVSNGAVVSAYEYSVDYISDQKVEQKTVINPMIKKLQDSINIFTQKIEEIDTNAGVNKKIEDILKRSSDKMMEGSKEKQGLSIGEFIQMMDYYQIKQTELSNSQLINTRKRNECQSAISRISTELAKITQESQPTPKDARLMGLIKINLSSPLALVAGTISISYYTPSASWIPYYDISVASIDKPVTIVSKAKVRQITGLDWSKVKLTLSSAVPSNGKVAPLFSAWFLQRVYAQNFDARSMQNSFSYASGASLKVMEVRRDSEDMDNKKNNAQSAQPLYIVDGSPVDAAYFAAIDASMVKSRTQYSGDEAVNLYGKGAAGGVYVIELKSSMDDYVTQADNELNTVFNIDMPYTIPGNGKEQSITLLTKTTPAEYKYYSAPKLDAQTFLLAEISDWQKLGLLSGKANVTYDGTYIGETFIDANSTHDKFALTLGSDKRVAVKREKLKEFSSTKFLGKDIKQVFSYKITVRNNQTKTVKMVLKDQYPISNEKAITVELLDKETTPWSFNKEDVGVITWEEDLAPGQVKEYKITYIVKYPEGTNLNL